MFARLNDNIYNLPLGELYFDCFKDYVQDDILNLEAMDLPDLKKRYELKDHLFGYLCNSFTILNESEFKDTFPITNPICRRISSVDSMVKFLVKQGNYEAAIRKMDKFILEMLEASNKILGSNQNSRGIR